MDRLFLVEDSDLRALVQACQSHRPNFFNIREAYEACRIRPQPDDSFFVHRSDIEDLTAAVAGYHIESEFGDSSRAPAMLTAALDAFEKIFGSLSEKDRLELLKLWKIESV